MKKILITGGSGFLGGHLVPQASRSWQVFTTYYQHPYNTSQEANWIRLDLTDTDSLNSVLKTIRPQVVIHTAARTNLDLVEQDKKDAYSVNVLATEKLAEASEACGARLIYVSTDMVFNGEKGNYTEEDRVGPINYYGKTKLMGEEKVAALCSNYVIARSALIYGRPKTGSNSFSEWILRKIEHEEEVTLYYDQFRTPILVQNLAQALLELAEIDFVGTIHLGGSERIDRYTFGLKMAHILGFSASKLKKGSMKRVLSLAPRPVDVSFNTSKTQKLLRTSLLNCDEGLRELLKE